MENKDQAIFTKNYDTIKHNCTYLPARSPSLMMIVLTTFAKHSSCVTKKYRAKINQHQKISFKKMSSESVVYFKSFTKSS